MGQNRKVREPSPSIKRIIDATSHIFAIPSDNLIIRQRTADVVLPRHVAMYLARHRTGASFPEIAFNFTRHHTTVMYAVQCIELYLLAGDKHLADSIRKIETALGARHG